MSIEQMTANEFADYLKATGDQFEEDDMQETAADYYEAAARIRVPYGGKPKPKNNTLCEWAADLSYQEMQDLCTFISRITIGEVEPTGAIVPLYSLRVALSLQLALEKDIET